MSEPPAEPIDMDHLEDHALPVPPRPHDGPLALPEWDPEPPPDEN